MTRRNVLLDFPAAARAAGIAVVERPGWRSAGATDEKRRPVTWQGGGPTAVVWHHDASPVGDSPGALAFMVRELAANRPSAQVWVDRRGVWHLIAAGVAYHAGRVLPGMPNNRQAVGIETDHTNGEAWPPEQLESLRRGTRLLLDLMGTDAGALHFHKTICDPPGRKTDPDGLSLHGERSLVTLTPPAPASVTSPAAAPQIGPTPMLLPFLIDDTKQGGGMQFVVLDTRDGSVRAASEGEVNLLAYSLGVPVKPITSGDRAALERMFGPQETPEVPA